MASLIVSIPFFGLHALGAVAAPLEISLLSLGKDNVVTDGAIQFELEFSGDLAAKTSSCSSLAKSVQDDFRIEFSISGESEPYYISDFRVSDSVIGRTSLRCAFSASFEIAYFEPNEESASLGFEVFWEKQNVITTAGTLLNPSFPGTLEISYPKRGDQVAGFTTLQFTGKGGAAENPERFSIAVCKVECYLRGYFGDDGYVSTPPKGPIQVFFKSLGVHEIRVSAFRGNVQASSSVFVNVTSTLSTQVLGWKDALNLISGASELIGLEANLDCGSQNLTWGRSRACQAKVKVVGRYSDVFQTTVPVQIKSSVNGGEFKIVRRLELKIGSSQSVALPVPQKGKSLTFRMEINDYTKDSGFYSVGAQSDQSWGPPPPSLYVSVPSTIRWGKSFTISVSSNLKSTGTCTALLNNFSRLSNFNLKNGRGSSNLKLVWDGNSADIALFVHCKVGGVALSGYRFVVGVR